MDLSMNALLNNYGERMRRLALYEPLMSLQNKTTRDNNNKKIDMYDLGLLTLLFFFENKLLRKWEIGVDELSNFLNEMTHKRISLDKQGYDKVATEIIRTFRPRSGKRLTKTFYDWENDREEKVFFSILKAGKSDIVINKQYYELDEDGLELIFSTREYFSEYQLSINQMLLRKQLEKGEFVNALRQIDEMNINVATLKDRIIRIKNEVSRNVISDKVFKRYKELIEDIHARLLREGKEFEELRGFVDNAIKNMRYDVINEKDEKIYNNALKVSKELELVHLEHNGLLHESIKIQTSTLKAAKDAFYYVGVESFNFNNELASKAVTEPLNIEQIKLLAKPFLLLEKAEIWSPLSVFVPQRVLNKNDNEVNMDFVAISEQEEERELRRTNEIFKSIMDVCLKHLTEENTILISDLVREMKKSKEVKMLESRYFYDFWIVLHQLCPIDISTQDKDKANSTLVGVIDLVRDGYKTMTVIERNDIVYIDERFSISNMEMKLEGLYEL